MGEEGVGEVSHISEESLRSSSSSGSVSTISSISSYGNKVGSDEVEILPVIHNPPVLSIKSEARYIPSS